MKSIEQRLNELLNKEEQHSSIMIEKLDRAYECIKETSKEYHELKENLEMKDRLIEEFKETIVTLRRQL